MYCLGNFVTDWIRMRPNKEGLIVRVVIQDKKVTRVSLAPLTRDSANNVLILDPSAGEGAQLTAKVKSLSADTPLKLN